MGLASKTKMYSEKVVSFSDIEREISIVPGEFRLSDIVVQFDNTGNYFSDLRKRTPFKNRVMSLLLGDTEKGESDLATIYKGKIENWGGANVFWIQAIDETLLRFEQKISGVITKNQFPDLPDDTPLELVPLVIGTVSSFGLSNTGALPAYLIDPAISQAKYQYVAAQGTIKSIDKVYKYGVLVGSGFTVQQRTFDGETFTTIEFDADQRDTSRPNELAVTWDGKGITDDGTPSGDNITNPALAWKEVLLQKGFVAGDLDTAEFDAMAIVFDVRNVTCGFATVDKDDTLRDLAERFAESFNMTTFTSRTGLITVTVPQPGSAATNLITVDESQTAIDSFGMEGSDEMASTLEYEFSRNWQAEEFDERLELTDPAQTSKIGEDLTKKAEFWYVIHPSSAAAVAYDKLFFMREGRVIINSLVDPTLFKQIKIGNDIRVTHFEGLGTAGFSKELFRTIGAGLVWDGENLLMSLRCVDLADAVLEFTTEYKKYLRKRPIIWTDTLSNEQQTGPPLVIS